MFALERMTLASAVSRLKSMEPRRASLFSINWSKRSEASPVSTGTAAIFNAIVLSLSIDYYVIPLQSYTFFHEFGHGFITFLEFLLNLRLIFAESNLFANLADGLGGDVEERGNVLQVKVLNNARAAL